MVTGTTEDVCYRYTVMDIYWISFWRVTANYSRRRDGQHSRQYQNDTLTQIANMGPTWVLSVPDGPKLAPWTLLSGYLNETGSKRPSHYVITYPCWHWSYSMSVKGGPGDIPPANMHSKGSVILMKFCCWNGNFPYSQCKNFVTITTFPFQCIAPLFACRVCCLLKILQVTQNINYFFLILFIYCFDTVCLCGFQLKFSSTVSPRIFISLIFPLKLWFYCYCLTFYSWWRKYITMLFIFNYNLLIFTIWYYQACLWSGLTHLQYQCCHR